MGWDGMWIEGRLNFQLLLFFLSQTRKADSPLVLRLLGNASKDVEEHLVVAGDAESHVWGEFVLLASSFQQRLKERMLKEWHPYHIPLAIFPHIHHKVAFWNVSRKKLIIIIATTVETRPPGPPTAPVCPAVIVEFPPLVKECLEEPPLDHHHLHAAFYLWERVLIRGCFEEKAINVMKWAWKQMQIEDMGVI